MTVMRIIRTRTVAPAPSAVPLWAQGLADMTWKTIAGTGRQIINVLPDPLPGGNFETPGGHAIVGAWNGGALDQVTGDFWVGGGGHEDYHGDEFYGCNVKADNPIFRRVNDPSATSGGSDATDGSGVYGSGRSRSTHTYSNLTAANGKLFITMLGAMSFTGFNTSTCFAVDGVTGAETNLGKPFASPPTDGSYSYIGSSAYDPVTNLVWCTLQYSSNKGFFSILAEPPYTITLFNNGGDKGYSYSAIAPDIRLWIVLGENGLYTLNLDNPSAGFSSRSESGTPQRGIGTNAFYHQPSRAFFGWNGNGQNIVRLGIPANPFSGTYAWSTRAMSGSTVSAVVSRGTFGRFNGCPDIGGGRSAIFLLNGINQPIYAALLPVAGT